MRFSTIYSTLSEIICLTLHNMHIRYPAKTSTFGIKSTMVPIIRNYDKNEFGKENLPKKSFFGSDQTTFSCQK